ncbi:phytochelatin synthase family protein [Calothrix sp. FACHB-1219]|uniref:phytochelatin synthase family protein n=1 Tax=unclassified Calothrix TaxID=2619626 RepID=UPI0016889C3F|nr:MULTISPECIES: phytochelatin synthase family protein [unclassified Calothrix]MBD2205024.1 phytochelatin synthase family protein [Calothrix sp. FACHB-168]MBD2219822.1 phytochelatin synthase family protein [Calothrix sp. FACHB-1219]
MKLKSFIKFLLLSICLTGSNALAQTLTLSPNLINFNSKEGEKLLIESQAREDFFPLSSQFITQNNQAYCGVASIVMVLNSLGIPAPEVPQYKPYRVFTQENFFSNEKTKEVISAEDVARKGMTLEQLGGLLQSYGVKVRVYHGSDISLDNFRKLAAENLQQPGNFIIVNYLRKTIGQERGGHISPVAAYNQQTDRFLILDVSRYKYPPVWVKAEELWKAMATHDITSGKTRGFVFVSKQ